MLAPLLAMAILLISDAAKADFRLCNNTSGRVGIAAMLALTRIDYSRFRELRVGLYTAMIASIALVLVLGGATRGSRRWIELPFFTFQPSELAKVLLIAALAGFALNALLLLSHRRRLACPCFPGGRSRTSSG